MLSKKEIILSAATKSFSQKGYGNTSMDFIAKEAAVSKQTVYSHFKNKDELFKGVVEQKSEQILRTLSQIAIEARSPELFLQEFGKTLMNMLSDRDILSIYRLAIAEAQNFPELSKYFHESGPKKAIDKMQEYLTMQDARGALVIKDTQQAAEIFVDMVRGSIIQDRLLNVSPKPTITEINMRVNEIVRIFLSAYGIRKK